MSDQQHAPDTSDEGPRHGTRAQGDDPYTEPSAGRETEWFGQQASEDEELAERLAGEGRPDDEIEQALRDRHGRSGRSSGTGTG